MLTISISQHLHLLSFIMLERYVPTVVATQQAHWYSLSLDDKEFPGIIGPGHLSSPERTWVLSHPRKLHSSNWKLSWYADLVFKTKEHEGQGRLFRSMPYTLAFAPVVFSFLYESRVLASILIAAISHSLLADSCPRVISGKVLILSSAIMVCPVIYCSVHPKLTYLLRVP